MRPASLRMQEIARYLDFPDRHTALIECCACDYIEIWRIPYGTLTGACPKCGDSCNEIVFFSSLEVAAIMGVSRSRVQKKARHLHVGRMFGRDLVFTRPDIESLRAYRPSGRPRKEPAL